jgi:hypothetical protein
VPSGITTSIQAGAGIRWREVSTMHKIFVIPLFFLLACSKKEEADKKPGILTLKEMSDLATVEYTVTKVIKADDNKTWFKVGDRKILMSCEAHIKAGIDMSAIDQNSFKITGKNIEVSLPQPKIISISLPAEGLKTEYEEVGGFRDRFTSADRDALAVQAEKQISASVESLGILEQAKINTSMLINNFLKGLGYENISIRYNGTESTILAP